MTSHKSKGLEFESVILYGLDRKNMVDRQPLVSFEIGPTGMLVGPIATGDEAPGVAHFVHERGKKRTEHELRRLLYVALTRARTASQLIYNLTFDAGEGGPAPPP